MINQGDTMNNRHVAATKDWFTIFWHSSFVSQLFVTYSGVIMKLASSTGSNPNFRRATVKAVSKLPSGLFPEIFSKLLNFTELFISSFKCSC